jgi:hypothetical protein
VVKIHTLTGEVWEYVNPSKDQVPILREPTLPRPEDVNPNISLYGKLLVEEKDDYKILQ